jgi:hypothetical protein
MWDVDGEAGIALCRLMETGGPAGVFGRTYCALAPGPSPPCRDSDRVVSASVDDRLIDPLTDDAEDGATGICTSCALSLSSAEALVPVVPTSARPDLGALVSCNGSRAFSTFPPASSTIPSLAVRFMLAALAFPA